MKYNPIISFCLIFCLSAGKAPAQFPIPGQLWSQSYTWGGEPECHGIKQTPDGGYILGGTIWISSVGNHDLFLAKINAFGETQWFRTYGGSSGEYGYSLTLTDDGSIVLAGWTTSFGTGGYDMYLIKTDSIGNLMWQKTYGISYNDVCYSVQQTPDGGFILGGSCVQGWDDMYLVKTDSLGNLQWQRTFGGPHIDYCYAVHETSDNGYIMGGFYGIDSDNCQAWLLKTNYAGEMIWDQTFSNSGSNIFHSVLETDDGKYIAGGNTESFGNSNQMYLVKTDSTGLLLWQNNYGGEFGEKCYTVLESPDQGYLLTGHGWGKFYTVKVDSSGSQLWDQTYTWYSNSTCFSSIKTIDGSYLLAGTNFNADNVLVVHISGLQQAWVSLQPSTPPITIPATGGSFQFTVSLTNCGTVFCRPAAWITVRLPNGQTYGPVLGPFSIPLDTAQVLSRIRTQNVPGNAPAGEYTYQAYVGTYNTAVWDSSSFRFIKLSDSGQAGMTTGESGDSGRASLAGMTIVDWVCIGDPFPGETVSRAGQALPLQFGIVGSSPNPFNPLTTLTFSLPEAAVVSLAVYNAQGRQIAVLAEGLRGAGIHTVHFDGTNLAGGIYFASLRADEHKAIRKMVLLK